MSKKFTIDMPKDNGIYYKSFRYPAGEIQTRLTKLGIETLQHSDEFEIITHDVPDLMEIAQLVDAINKIKYLNDRRLFLQYLPYGRADRRFQEGDSYGLQVFFQLLGMVDLTSVWTFDAHNEEKAIRLALLYGIKLVNMKPTHDLVDQIQPCLNRMRKTSGHGFEVMALISPDEGAAKRYDLSKYGLKTFIGEKKRDPKTGALSGFHIGPDIIGASAALIVDDICDGGGTFIGLAEEIRKINPNIKLGLYVSHGIFSKGLEVLEKQFDWIFGSDYSFFKGPSDERGETFKTGNEEVN